MIINSTETVNKALNLTDDEFRRLQAIRMAAMASMIRRNPTNLKVVTHNGNFVSNDVSDIEFLVEIFDRAVQALVSK